MNIWCVWGTRGEESATKILWWNLKTCPSTSSTSDRPMERHFCTWIMLICVDLCWNMLGHHDCLQCCAGSHGIFFCTVRHRWPLCVFMVCSSPLGESDLFGPSRWINVASTTGCCGTGLEHVYLMFFLWNFIVKKGEFHIFQRGRYLQPIWNKDEIVWPLANDGYLWWGC